MTNQTFANIFDFICVFLSVVFFWSTTIVLIGLIKKEKKHPKAAKKLKFAVLICARNEESVIRLPVKSILLGTYPADKRDVIVLADNCTDNTAQKAREAGAIVWEKTIPSHGKGDVLTWGINKVLADGSYDAISVFDADNIASDRFFDEMNDALNDGEYVVTGRRHSSNAKANVIAGWYTVYWDMMNELSNRVRTNLGLSGKLTGTGFAFLISALGNEGWKTHTMVEDVEFTVQTNIRGKRVAYVPKADYADEQPVTAVYMWRQLRRWATGSWQVARSYCWPWLKGMFTHPSLRLFDSYFAILTGMSVAFILLFNVVALSVKLCFSQSDNSIAWLVFFLILGFVFVMGWFTSISAVALSKKKRRPKWIAVALFPIFSLILCGSVLYTLFFPTKTWKPIPHGTKVDDGVDPEARQKARDANASAGNGEQ